MGNQPSNKIPCFSRGTTPKTLIDKRRSRGQFTPVVVGERWIFEIDLKRALNYSGDRVFGGEEYVDWAWVQVRGEDAGGGVEGVEKLYM